MYYYCEEFGYYVNAPDCGLCHFRHDCEVRDEKEGEDCDPQPHAQATATNQTERKEDSHGRQQ